jgi:hypothetical protein
MNYYHITIFASGMYDYKHYDGTYIPSLHPQFLIGFVLVKVVPYTSGKI